jgi:lipoprotein-releasing system permease protein
MIKNYEWMIAWRYLRSKRREGFISVVSAFSLLGIILGVATLIIVMSVMKGYEIELINRIIGINSHVTIGATDRELREYKLILDEVKQNPDVSYVAPIVMGQALATTNNFSTGVEIRGMNGDDIAAKPLVHNSLIAGNFADYQKQEGVLIGKALARQLRAQVGDELRLISPKTNISILGAIPRSKTFKIVGIFDVGMYEYNSSTIFMPLNLAQLFFDYDETVTDIEVLLTDPYSVKEVAQKIAMSVAQDLIITNWQQNNENIVQALAVERNVMFLILMLIILVATFNIISGLIMLVKEKSYDIAILRTIGMHKLSVIKIFVIAGSMIGIIGSLIGGGLGIWFSLNIQKIKETLESLTGITLFDPVIYFLTTLPSHLVWSDVVLVMSISLLLSFLATIYPAWKAAKLMPAEALRYE